MKLTFLHIKIKNFLSFGEQETTFDYVKGIHAVTGNLIPNSTMRNGVGKSTLIADSIVFAIYGRTLRKLNKDEIINTHNERDCVVQCLFYIDDTKYLVERGIKPTYLKIWENDNEVQFDSMANTQAWLMNKINVSFECFTNMIILNINHSKPFLAMEPKEKRPVLEDITQLTLYGKMNEKAKKNYLSANKDVIQFETAYKSALTNFTKTEERKANIDKEIAHFEDSKKRKIEEIQKDIEKTENDRNVLFTKIQGVSFTEDLTTQTQLLKKITVDINNIEKDLRVLIKDIEQNTEVKNKLIGTPHCPLCATPTASPNIVEYINSLTEKITNWVSKKDELKLTLQQYKNDHVLIEDKIEKLHQNIDKLKKAESKIQEYDNYIKLKKENLVYEQSRSNNLNTIISQEDYDKLCEELKNNEIKYKDAQKALTYNKCMRDMLGDEGIRKYIISLKVIPFLIKSTNHYLSILGSDYTITFDNDLNETLISRNRDKRSYSSFSGGEKRRIDLSILLAFMDIAKSQNSIDTNILILDEILDTSLDNDGVESFLDHMNGSFKQAYPDKCIYIITHRKDAVGDEHFDSIIHLVKENGFTTIDKIVN